MKHRATIALLLCATAAAFAQPPQPNKGQQQEGRGEQGHERRGPPAEAFAACKGKKDGDSATLKTPGGEQRKGSCRMVFIPDDKPAR
jgi:hypothetical protein